jgi:CspA family cold shock protein
MVTPNYISFLQRKRMQVALPVICMTCFMNTGPEPKQQGKVKWFNPNKRYGFITDQEGQEVFLHQKHILNGTGASVREGQQVRFHLHYAPKGPEAWNVELA